MTKHLFDICDKCTVSVAESGTSARWCQLVCEEALRVTAMKGTCLNNKAVVSYKVISKLITSIFT